mmetsp:Transcript_55215/g.131137  ORF Transcript_55215/g.131137 Transcript_55215/m.131137 type:complete len:367 (+) Transcript_55215:2185-3285(+)
MAEVAVFGSLFEKLLPCDHHAYLRTLRGHLLLHSGNGLPRCGILALRNISNRLRLGSLPRCLLRSRQGPEEVLLGHHVRKFRLQAFNLPRALPPFRVLFRDEFAERQRVCRLRLCRVLYLVETGLEAAVLVARNHPRHLLAHSFQILLGFCRLGGRVLDLRRALEKLSVHHLPLLDEELAGVQCHREFLPRDALCLRSKTVVEIRLGLLRQGLQAQDLDLLPLALPRALLRLRLRPYHLRACCEKLLTRDQFVLQGAESIEVVLERSHLVFECPVCPLGCLQVLAKSGDFFGFGIAVGHEVMKLGARGHLSHFLFEGRCLRLSGAQILLERRLTLLGTHARCIRLNEPDLEGSCGGGRGPLQAQRN